MKKFSDSSTNQSNNKKFGLGVGKDI